MGSAQTPPTGTGTCEECGFDWSLPIQEAVALVRGSPERCALLFAGTGPQEALREAAARDHSADPGRWSPAAYLWHLVDVIRFGTERLWTLALDPEAGVPGWSQEEVAAARRYDGLSVAVGLRALEVAVGDWADAARGAPRGALVVHPELGAVSTEDSIRRNAHEIQHHELDILRGLGGT